MHVRIDRELEIGTTEGNFKIYVDGEFFKLVSFKTDAQPESVWNEEKNKKIVIDMAKSLEQSATLTKVETIYQTDKN